VRLREIIGDERLEQLDLAKEKFWQPADALVVDKTTSSILFICFIKHFGSKSGSKKARAGRPISKSTLWTVKISLNQRPPTEPGVKGRPLEKAGTISSGGR
jgi:hypothetical protein